MTETSTIPGVSLGRRLAVGGMGELFLAERTRADGGVEPCVVKRLLPGAGEAERSLFAREARALRAVSDPHVVGLLDAGADWILLERVDGVDLATLLDARRKRGRPLPVEAAWTVILGMTRGLVALARAGLVHRDVHPGNVLLGRDGAVKLADLGIAAFSAEAGPTIAGLKGTLAYMAPEQLQAGTATARSDVYAAGLVAWEALTGVPARPMGASGLAELLAARSRLPAPPSELRSGLRVEVDLAILGALAPEPAARPADAAAWLERLVAAGEAAQLASDPERLAALVGELADQRAASQALAVAGRRTIAPSGAVGDGAAGESGAMRAVTAPVGAGDVAAGKRRRWVVWALGGAIAAGAGVAGWALGQGGGGAAGGASGADEVVVGAVETEVASESEVESEVESEFESESESEVASDVPPTDTSVARDVHPTRAPADAVVAVATARHRLTIAPGAAGQLYVSGGGLARLAPATTDPIEEGQSALFTLTGGTGGTGAPFQTTLRVAFRAASDGHAARVVASLGAPKDTYYDVTCAGHPARTTPVVGLGVGPGAAGLACRVETRDGRAMAFVLSDARE